MAYNKQQWKDEIPDLTKPIRDSSGKQKTDPQTGRPLYELVQEGTRLTSQRLNHIEDGIEIVHELAGQNAADIDTHKKDTVKHITAAERAEWKAKETPVGAQTKADAALSSAKTYADTALLVKADKLSTYSKTETDQRIQAVVGAAPDALDTLKEIGDALNNDPNFAATVTNQLSVKVDKVSGKQLSTEDYSSAEKAKLAGLTPGAGAVGSATDATIGNRTADPSIATPYSLTGSLTQWFSWLTKYLKTISGKANPFDPPDITLAATKTHVDSTVVHLTAVERSAWNAAETNAKNASISKTEKGVAGGVAALDATKLMLSDGTILGSRVVERVFNFSFANGVANQKIDVIFPVNGGLYEIEVIGSFNTVNTAGKIVKRFNGTYSNPASYPSGTQYTEVTGVVKSHISIGEPFLDSDSKWRVSLEARTAAPNPFTVIARVLSGGGAATAPTLSAVYTGTAATTLPVAVQSIPDDTVTQSGYLIQKHQLTQNNGTAFTITTGSVDTLTTSGLYNIQSSSVTGLPGATTGILVVEDIIQRFTETPTMRTWKRRWAGTWNAWVEDENASRKNVASGYAGLGSDAKFMDAQIPLYLARKAGTLADATDLNTLGEGEYCCPSNASAATMLNLPAAVTGQSFFLKVTKHAGFNQTLTTYVVGVNMRVFTRNIYNGVISEWYEQEHSGKKNLANGYAGLDASVKVPRVNTYSSLSGTGTTITNMDTLYAAGVHAIGNSATGAPETGYGQAIVHVSSGEVHDNVGNWIWQMWFGVTGGTWVRQKVNNGIWQPWAKMWTGKNDGELLVSRPPIANNTDYNTITTNGVYPIYQPTGTSNSPLITYGLLTVSKGAGGVSYTEQRAIDVLTGITYSRIANASVFTPWVSNITSGGGTMKAPLLRDYGTLSVKYHNLASYYSNGVVTGTIKITLPVAWNQAMMRIKISGYEYVNGKGAWELTLGGYNFATGWAQVSAYAEGGLPFTSVRFAYDGAKCCILLGGLTTPWNYPSIEVSEVLASHNGAAGLGGAWTVTILAAENGITSVLAAPIVWGNANTLNGFTTSVAAAANTIPVRNASGELEGVSSVLAKAEDKPITNSSAGIMALNYMVTGTDQTLMVLAYLSLMSVSDFSMYISYTDPRLGLKNYGICPLKRLESEAYVFVPAFIRAKAGTEVRLMVIHSDDAFPAYITASIGKG
ncbi:pyocin knob domain-containing protein [Paenibacillus sp. Marseille-Q9583]